MTHATGSPRRCVITGGAGFIGSHVVDAYLAAGHEVAVLDNLASGKRENLGPVARFYEVDLRAASAVEAVVAEFRPQVINHHAAQASVAVSVQKPGFDAENNVLGMINLLEAARAHGVQRVLYSSTGGALYGETDRIPTPEDHPTRPLSPYGCAKLCGEEYLATWHRLHGLEYLIFRYGNVYGPRQSPHGEAGVVAIFAGLMREGRPPTIFGPGGKTRDYVYVGEVARASLLALDCAPGATVNIATGRQTTDRQVFEAVAAAVGYAGPPLYGPERAGDLQHSCLDITHARRLLGWEPQIEFAEGVRRTVAHLSGEG